MRAADRIARDREMAALLRSGEPVGAVAERFDVSRVTVWRRVGDVTRPARKPGRVRSLVMASA